jgi:predicted nucleic acid-binding Zn ribbon protein
MALVPCRECGKEVSDQAEACPFCGIKTPSKKKRQRNLIITVVLVLAAIAISAWGYHRISQAFAPPVVIGVDGKPVITTPVVPKLQPSVPVKQQIIQKDYKEKIREMLDSGQSVHEISKKTGMRIDEVRKIKKEKAQDEKTK